MICQFSGDILVLKEGDFLHQVRFVDLCFGDAKVTFYNFAKTSSAAWNPQWHNHIYYELHFSFGVTVGYKFSDRNIILNPGEMVIIPPTVEHESVTANYPKKDFLVISLDIEKIAAGGEFYESFVSALKANAVKPIKIPENLKEDLMALDCDEFYKTSHGVCKLKTAASQVVYAIFKKIMPDKPVKTESSNQKILIDTLIFAPDATLDTIAAATNYSRRHLSRIMKEQYGMTFSQIRRKMQKGKGNE